MDRAAYEQILQAAADRAMGFVRSADSRPVRPEAGRAALHRALGGPLPEHPTDLQAVLDELVTAADPDRHTKQVVERVQADGTCWMSGTTWQGQSAMRISVSNWVTSPSDVDRSVDAVLRCAGLARG